MTNRDRAWRRRTERLLSHRGEEARHPKPEGTVEPLRDFKQHQPGKLTPVQSLRQDWQLRADAEDAFSSDAITPVPVD